MSERPSCSPGSVVFASDAVGFGGAEILAADLAAALARRGVDVRFAVRADAPGLDKLRARLGPVPLVHAPFEHKSAYRTRLAGALGDAPRIAAIAERLRELGPTTLVVNQPDPEDGHALALAATTLRSRPRVISLLHLPQDLPTLGARRFALARTASARLAYRALHHRLIAISEASAREAAARWMPAGRVRACTNGIPLPALPVDGERTAARSALAVARDATVVSFLGRLDAHQKGLDLLPRALAWLRCAPPSLTVLIAGEGPDRARLEAELRTNRLTERVRLLGWREPRQVLLATDVLVLPSRFEGLPLVALEAGALGVDVVATAVGGLVDVLEPSALTPPRDAASFARALDEALADPAAREARARRLQERVRRDHSIEAMAERFERLLVD